MNAVLGRHARVISHVVVLVAMVCGRISIASAEPFSIGVQGGSSRPLGDFADAHERGPYFGFTASQPIVDEQVNVFLEVNYHSHGARAPQPFFFNNVLVHESLRVTETALGIRIPFLGPRAPVSPYFRLALAVDYVEPKLVIDTPSQSIIIEDPKLEPGGIGALGLSVRLGPTVGFRVDAAYHVIETESKVMNVSTLGLMLWTGIGHR